MTGEKQPAPRDEPPYALTDQHIKALELAISAEGYEILIDPETGEISLQRREGAAPERDTEKT